MARTLPIRTFLSSGAAAALTALALAGVPGAARAQALPADGESAVQRLEKSPRHGEWVKVDAGNGDMVEAWVVYPERADAAPVVLVIHEIYGMSDWVRAVADQLASEGFIAIAPDLLSGKGPGGGGTASFESQADLQAAVAYYGSSPQAGYESIRAPILAFYGGNDNRVNATIPAAEEAMKALGKSFEPHVLEGAGHGFLRQQSGQEGANMKATEQAWPRTVAFLREHLGR